MQVQRWLGHHSASFTLDTYVHLLDNDLGEPLQAASAAQAEAEAFATQSKVRDTAVLADRLAS